MKIRDGRTMMALLHYCTAMMVVMGAHAKIAAVSTKDSTTSSQDSAVPVSPASPLIHRSLNGTSPIQWNGHDNTTANTFWKEHTYSSQWTKVRKSFILRFTRERVSATTGMSSAANA
jgi:hypothetical protein